MLSYDIWYSVDTHGAPGQCAVRRVLAPAESADEHLGDLRPVRPVPSLHSVHLVSIVRVKHLE